MQINILYRPAHTLAQVWLHPNEAVVAETGAMVGMSTNVQMQTQSGGLMSGLKRMFSGESFFNALGRLDHSATRDGLPAAGCRAAGRRDFL